MIVAAHNPLAPGSARNGYVAWNGDELSELLEASPAVAVCLSGHDHHGGYARQGLTHFVTLEAMLEAPEGSTAYAVLEVWASHGKGQRRRQRNVKGAPDHADAEVHGDCGLWGPNQTGNGEPHVAPLEP